MSTSPGIQHLRPLALGEMVDRSATFWRAHLKPLFLLCLGFELVSYIFRKGVMLALQSNNVFFQGNAALQAQSQDNPLGVLGDAGTMLLSMSVLWVVLIWSYWLSMVVVSRYVIPLQLGEPARPADGLRRALSRLGAFTGAYVLSQFWALGATLLMLLPGGLLCAMAALLGRSNSSAASVVGVLLLGVGALLLGLGLLAALLWYFLRFALLAPVFAMEDLGALGAFRRSGQLISGRIQPGFLGRVKVRAMILITVVSGILLAIGLVFGLPAMIVQFSYANPLDPNSAANAVPQVLLVPVELLQVVGQALFTPFALVFSAMFYLDMRMRREGLDLERRLDASHSAAA